MPKESAKKAVKMPNKLIVKEARAELQGAHANAKKAIAHLIKSSNAFVRVQCGDKEHTALILDDIKYQKSELKVLLNIMKASELKVADK